MFDKNDPLIASVKQVMENNAKERAATQAVNEKFGITSRKALPHERQGEWDAAYNAILSEGISVEKVNSAKPFLKSNGNGTFTPQNATKVQGGQGIQGYDKQSKAASPTTRPHGDNPQVTNESDIKHPNQQNLDVHEPEKDELTSADFKKLRMKKIMSFRKKTK